jgi:hypothetical protein
MRRTGIFWLIYPSLFAAVLIALALFVPPTRGSSAPQRLQAEIPSEGWQVCAIGGLETIPEVGEQRQVFELCHGDGWRYKAYCLNPQMPVPELNTRCSVLGNETVWCGDLVQQLRLYALLEQAEDTPTPTVTTTATATSTATITATPTSPAATITATATPTRTRTPVLPGEDFPPRPRPGGPGNLQTLLFLGGLITASVGLFTLLEVDNRRSTHR